MNTPDMLIRLLEHLRCQKNQKSFGKVDLNGTARAELQVPHKVLKCQKFYHLWREMSDLSELQLLKSLDAPPWIYKLHLRKQMQTQRHLKSLSNTTLQRQIQRLLGSLANTTLRTNSRKQCLRASHIIASNFEMSVPWLSLYKLNPLHFLCGWALPTTTIILTKNLFICLIGLR